ncbi:MAG: class II fructose-bisphosphatase [Candidatus Micrarchaeota archaeon]
MQDTIIQNKDFQNQLLRVTEKAAIACYEWIGKKNAKSADQAAVDAMRKEFNFVDIDGTVVIGEGERDEAPMLYIGEKVGNGKGPECDIAVDPLEGTNLCANNLPNAVAVLALAPKGTLLHAPDTYMDKIAVGPKIGNAVSLKRSVKENLEIVSQKLGKPMKDVRVIMLERDRHKQLAKEVIDAGAQIKYISDGDVFGAVATLWGKVDILLGIGAAPEGVLAASALKPLGGYMEGMLKFRNEDERKRAIAYGMKEPDKLLTINDLVKTNESLFMASGVTDGDYLNGVKIEGKIGKINSVVIDKYGHRIIEERLDI